MNSDSSSTVILSMASSRSSWVRTAMSGLLVGCAGSWPIAGSDGSDGSRDRRGRWSRALGLGPLVPDLAQRVAEVPDVRDEQARQGGDRCLHPSGAPAEPDVPLRLLV